MKFRKQPNETSRRNVPVRRPAEVFSYYSNRSAPDSARARYEVPSVQARTIGRLKHMPTILALVAIFAALAYASVLDTTPRVMVAANESGKQLQRDEAVYADFISSELKRSVFNKSKLTFDSKPLTKSLRKEFPEIDNAIVTIPLLGHRPVVHLAVSSPAFVLASQNGAYYLSAKGIPLVRVSEAKNQIHGLKTVSDQTNLPITVGQQVLPEDTVSFISELIQQFDATETGIESIILPLEANEVQVRLVGKSYFVRLNVLEDARTQVGTLLAVINRLTESREEPKEYIDVRVQERAYYK